jgi:hypothetical protein
MLRELSTGGDVELAEDVTKMPLDCLLGHEQSFAISRLLTPAAARSATRRSLAVSE